MTSSLVTVSGAQVRLESSIETFHGVNEEPQVVQPYAQTTPEVMAGQVSAVFADRRDNHILYGVAATGSTKQMIIGCPDAAGNRPLYLRYETKSVAAVIQEYTSPTRYTLEGKILEIITTTDHAVVCPVQIYNSVGAQNEPRETFRVVSLLI